MDSNSQSPRPVALIQSFCGNQFAENLQACRRQMEQAVEQGSQLICLQEVFALPYPCQQEDHARFAWAETIPGPTTDFLGQFARQHQQVIVAGLFEKRAAGLYHNTAVVIEKDGSLRGIYRKMHIPDDPHYYEKFYFAPGDLGFQVFSTSVGRLGVAICWDQWFPEAARLMALKGAQMCIYPTAIGWLPEDKEPYGESQLSAWQTLLRSHAIANGMFVFAPNRVGVEGKIEFWGNSLAIDPYGQTLACGSPDQQQVLVVEVDFERIETARTHWPFLRDRRVDAYSNLNRLMIDD